MKSILTALFICCCFAATSSPVYQKLYEVNKCWAEQKDINREDLAALQSRTETEWIQLHLSLVEKTLRSRSTSHLSESQKQNRLAALNYLHGYWQAASFPRNEDYSYRTPIFIDKHDNFCAVGYLVKAIGFEHVSRMISAKTNLAYVKEMNYPELFAWADAYGFTVDELAWIQPAYPPEYAVDPVGKGTNGVVNELCADAAGKKLYMGGSFSMVDGSIAAGNIAYITEAGGKFTWHDMAGGVNGPVHAIAEFDNKIFVAGNFTQAGGKPANSVAYWDGATWHNAGCLGGMGIVKDLIVYKNNLYATGSFDVCAALNEVNVARWNGTMWSQMPVLEGRVNTAHVFGNDLVLGGAFTLNNETVNAVKWNEGSGYQKFENTISNEVMDFEVYRDTLYAVCRHTTGSTEDLYTRLEGNTWKSVPLPEFASDSISFNTLCLEGDRMLMGGHFYGALSLTTILHCMDVTPQYYYDKADSWFVVNDAINKMVIYKNYLIVGGKFTFTEGNGIAYMPAKPAQNVSIPGMITCMESFKMYPNPAKSSTTLKIESSVNNGNIMLRDMSGKLLLKETVNSQVSEITLPALNSGLYMLELNDASGSKTTEKLIVE